MIRILLIDNTEEFCKSFKGDLLDNPDFSLEYRTDLVSGISELRTNKEQYDIVILDGRGVIEPGGVEHDVHVTAGISRIRDLDEELPIFIYTAFVDNIKVQLQGTMNPPPVFDKGELGKTAMFEAITYRCANHSLFSAKHKHPELFEIFDNGYLPKDDQGLYPSFVDMVLTLEESNLNDLSPKEVKGLLDTCRQLLEAIIDGIDQYFDHVFEHELSTWHALDYLAGSPRFNDSIGRYEPTTKVYMDRAVSQLASMVWINPSQYLHFIRNKSGFYTRYGLISVINAIFEVMRWYKFAIEENIFDK